MCVQGGKNTEEEQTSSRNPNNATLSKGREIYTKTLNEMYHEDIAVFWEENYIQLDALNHNHAN